MTSIRRIIIRICQKNIEFCGKTSKFLPKRCLSLIKYAENEISISNSYKKQNKKNKKSKKQNKKSKTKKNKKKKKTEEQKHNPTSKTSILKLFKNCQFLY